MCEANEVAALGLAIPFPMAVAVDATEQVGETVSAVALPAVLYSLVQPVWDESQSTALTSIIGQNNSPDRV